MSELCRAASRSFHAKPPLFTWSATDPRDAPPSEYLVDGLIPQRGAHLVLGPPKSGKSQLVAHAIACLLTGNAVFSHYQVTAERGPRILWLMVEETRYKPRARVEANLRGFGMSDKAIFGMNALFDERLVISGRDSTADRALQDSVFSIERHEPWLRRLVRSGEFDVIVLDSLRPAHQREENSSTEMLPVTSLMRELSGEVCLLILHHTGHSSGDVLRFGGDAGRGTSDLDAARDTAIHLRQGTFGGVMLLGFHHRDDAQVFVAVETLALRQPSIAVWKYLRESEDPDGARGALDAGRLLAAVDAAKMPEELPSKTDAKKLVGDAYSDLLVALQKQGVIQIRVSRMTRLGSPRHLITRPGQFSDDEWQAAEERTGKRA